MKKTIGILLAVTLLAIGFLSCSKNTDDYIHNLGSTYDIEVETGINEIEKLASIYDLDADEYSVEMIIYAQHKKTGCGVMIIECGSKPEARELLRDADGIVSILEASYSSKYSFDAVRDGHFVLIGEESAINAALGK